MELAEFCELRPEFWSDIDKKDRGFFGKNFSEAIA